MKSKICGFILFMLLAAGTAFGQTKELTCDQQGHNETQLTLNYDNRTAFFHANQATAPSPAEFTADTISWHSSWDAHQRDGGYITHTVYYELNRNTGTLQAGRGEGGRYSCSVSDKKF
jgi:hypothetical protein